VDSKVTPLQNSTVRPVGERASPAPPSLPPEGRGGARPAHPVPGAAPATRPETPRPAESSKPAAPDHVRDLRLQFRIDPQTNDIVVLMIDRATRRVVRAIPPQELSKFDKGQLLELIA